MKKLIIPILFMTLGLLASCGKELTTPVVPDKVAIVESYLYSGDSAITIKVTKLLPYSDDTTDATEYISGLHLQINGTDLNETSPGIYSLALGEKRLQSGETYVMKFLYFSDTVSSITTIPDKPMNFTISSNTIYTDRITSESGGMPSGPPTDLILSWDNPDDSYYYVVIEYLESTRDYINYRSKSLDLSDTTSISPTNASETRLGTRNLNFFGSYRIVLFKVNEDFADLYQQSAVNSNNIITPVTTINNGFGVFTGMAGDTVYLEVLEN